MKKQFELAYGFKSNSTSINGHLSKLEDFVHSRQKHQRNIFTPIGNELLTPSKNISLKGCPILYPLKHNDLWGYDPICLISSGLLFDDIIMNILKNKKLECHNEEDDYLKKRNRTTTFTCTWVHFNIFTERKAHTSVYMFHMYIYILKETIWNIIWPIYLKAKIKVMIWMKE